ncbi:MAG: inositol monophosphatase [Planctomycetia bacterium]|nr:inositol monophosphatase [Planctomycetia bacterium]
MRLEEYRNAAQEAARRGAAVLAGWRGKFKVREKGYADLVSEADLEAQQAIREYLQGRFGDHAFLGEEGDGAKTRPGPNAPPTWIVDPLDGTTNYVHDLPLYSVSIGLQVDGELVVGVVLDPARGEMFHAAKGYGAAVNDEPLRTSVTPRLEAALLLTGFPPDLRRDERSLDWWRYFSFRAQSMRRLGSTAINLAWLAAGRADGFYAFDNHVWDVAGGIVILREAGGIATRTDGSAYDPYVSDIAASNGPLHPVLLAALALNPQQPKLERGSPPASAG